MVLPWGVRKLNCRNCETLMMWITAIERLQANTQVSLKKRSHNSYSMTVGDFCLMTGKIGIDVFAAQSREAKRDLK